MSSSSACSSGGISSRMFRPMISSAGYPNMRSALAFQLVIVPSNDLLMIASLDVSTTAAR